MKYPKYEEVLPYAKEFCAKHGYSGEKLDGAHYIIGPSYGRIIGDIYGAFIHASLDSSYNPKVDGYRLDESNPCVPSIEFGRDTEGFSFRTTEYTDRYLSE